jgi:hypothetical protein
MIRTVVVVMIQYSLRIAGDRDIRGSGRSAFSRAKSWLGIHRKNAESCEVAFFPPEGLP